MILQIKRVHSEWGVCLGITMCGACIQVVRQGLTCAYQGQTHADSRGPLRMPGADDTIKPTVDLRSSSSASV